jgi:hypothetical protein
MRRHEEPQPCVANIRPLPNPVAPPAAVTPGARPPRLRNPRKIRHSARTAKNGEGQTDGAQGRN